MAEFHTPDTRAKVDASLSGSIPWNRSAAVEIILPPKNMALCSDAATHPTRPAQHTAAIDSKRAASQQRLKPVPKTKQPGSAKVQAVAWHEYG